MKVVCSMKQSLAGSDLIQPYFVPIWPGGGNDPTSMQEVPMTAIFEINVLSCRCNINIMNIVLGVLNVIFIQSLSSTYSFWH